MIINRINPLDNRRPLTLNEIIEARIEVSPDLVRYTREGLINLVSLIVCYKLTITKDMLIDSKKDLFVRIGRNEHTLLKIIRSYIVCQLEVVDEVLKDSLDSLIESSHSKKINITSKNNIVSFTYDIIEDIQLIRMSEFGYYCLNEVYLNMFNNISQEDVGLFQKRIKTIRDQSIIDKIHNEIFVGNSISSQSIDEIKYKFLLRILAFSHNPKKVNKHVAYVFGSDTINHINYFIGQWMNLSQTVEFVVNRRGLKQRQNRGPKI